MEKYDQLKKFIKERETIDENDVEQICSYFKFVKTERNQMLCNEGQVCKHFYFINKGSLRLYEIDGNGNDVTGFFALENFLMTALTSFITQKPSRDFLVSMESSELLVIHKDDFFKLMETIPKFATIYHQIIEFGFIHSQMRIYCFLGMDAMDRLKWVMDHEPKLLTRISSKAVASYLGMTNSTLSKLRAKLNDSLS